MNQSKRLLKIAIILDVILVAVLSYGVYSVLAKHEDTIKKEAELLEEKAKISSIQALSFMLQDTKEDRDLLGSLFVDRNSVVDFSELIESIGGMSGAEVKVEDIVYPEGKDSAGYALVRFKVLGTWQELAKTLSLVDEIPMAAVVNKLELISEKSNEEDEIVDNKKNEKSVPGWQATFTVRVLKDPTK
ncbi:MAG: hypothetical protein A3H57_02040 [Candidatus Taylorbacteria bacterium RIFCSPLOWO2_02_FULL_43_11]|nr:MAG: hypothetical protein A2743_04230 [Candidatus Taylorbacteria bacterium RIFCSPHIGHO2_01_FULL_43_47]OHA37034.1 MAG: hypothetical protein A3H57_02040 [Candidatus Taylorbacteria bacterium RIFCSPLOWO2_02_FULL_43_11]